MAGKIKSLDELNRAYKNEAGKKRQQVQTTSKRPAEEPKSKKSAGSVTNKKPVDRSKRKRPADSLTNKRTAAELKSRKPVDSRIDKKPADGLKSRKPVGGVTNKKPTGELKRKNPADSLTSKKNASRLKSRLQRQAQVRLSKSVVAIVGIVVIIIICLFLGSKDSVRNKLGASEKIVPSILTSEEQEKWENMAVQKGKFYIELNTRIKVNDTKAYIRLINPVYSAYTFSIQMWEKGDRRNPIYVSEKLKPGTILEAVNLTRSLTSDECEVVVNYVIYDELGEEKSSYPIDVKLIQENITTN